MNGLMDFILHNWAAHVVASLIILVGGFVYLQRKHGFFLMDMKYRLFKIRGLSKDFTKDSMHPEWTQSESALCEDYAKHVQMISEAEFRNLKLYLNKAGDGGRKPTSVAMWFFIGVLVILEALGFSYLLGTWIAADSSEYMRIGLMVAVVAVLGIIFPWLMHAGGHNLYEYLLYKRNFRLFKESNGASIESGCVDLDSDQTVDDGQPSYVHVVNRIRDRVETPLVFGFAIFAIILVLTGSTYMRISHLKTTLAEQAQEQTAQIDNSDPFAAGLPDLPATVGAAQKQADKKVEQDKIASTMDEGMAAFVVLGVIFLITQFLGIFTGYSRSFGGKESEHAYKIIRGFATFNEFIRFFEPRVKIASARLKALQQKLNEKSPTRQEYSLAFLDYLKSQKSLKATVSEMNLGAAHYAAPALVQAVPVAEAPSTVIQDILVLLDGMATKEEKLAHLASLTEEVRGKVKEALSARQASQQAAAAQAQLAADFEGVL